MSGSEGDILSDGLLPEVPADCAELLKLGFVISEKTVSRYMPRRPAGPDQVKRWVAFQRNHRQDIAAMDLFTVPTASLRLLSFRPD